MTDPLVKHVIKQGMGRMGRVMTPGWQRLLDDMPRQAHTGFKGARDFAACTRQGAIALAGRGGGKSTATLGRFHAPSAAHANQSSVFVTMSSQRSREILSPAVWKFNELYKLGIEDKVGDGAFIWPNGYRVLYRGCKDRNEVNKRRGTPWVRAHWDECFVTGTPIRSVGRVIAHSSRVAPSTLVTIDGITSTDDHPYLTPGGWKRAIEINPGDMLCVRRADASQDGLSASDLLQDVSLDAIARDFHTHTIASDVCKSQAPMEGPSHAPGDERRERHSSARRERPWAYCSRVTDEQSHWIADTRGRENRHECAMGPQRVPGNVQVGPCLPIDAAGDRDRRADASQSATTREGREKRELATWRRVDRVEVHERGGIGRYDQVCPDGLVHNLTTESGVYFAGEALVHNCASINDKLFKEDIHDAVEPRLVDFNGLWSASGTPGPIPKGYWYELSSGDTATYPLFKWDARHNHHMPNVMQYFAATLRRMGGIPDRKLWPRGCTSIMDLINDSRCWKLLPNTFVREYLGQWVLDLRALIYKLTPKNTYTEFPIVPDRWTIGVDLGAHSEERPDLDHAAVCVCASHSSLPFVWVVMVEKLSDCTVDSLGARVLELVAEFPEAEAHIDAASAGKLIENSFRRMGIPIMAAEKAHKLRRIQRAQGAIRAGNLQLHATRCMDARVEATSLVWNDERKDHSPRCDDDAWDCILYGAIPHLDGFEPAQDSGPAKGTPEYERLQELKEFEQALEEAMGDDPDRAWDFDPSELWIPGNDLWLPLAA